MHLSIFIYFLSVVIILRIFFKMLRFFAGIYSCKELVDIKPEQTILYSQNLNT